MAEQLLFDRALPYYVVGISVALLDHGMGDEHPTWRDIDIYWEGALIDYDLIQAAFNVCIDYKLIEPLDDEFAPTLLIKPINFTARYDRLRDDPRYAQTFNKYAKGGRKWLSHAIMAINRQRQEEPKSEGSSRDNKFDPRWEPIPLDRADQKLQDATNKLEEAIETIRSDNGYNATHPEEARYVVDGLRMLTKRLKEDVQISWIYIDDGLQRLSLVVNRFGKAATGLAAKAAKSALTDWLKGLALDFLKSLIK